MTQRRSANGYVLIGALAAMGLLLALLSIGVQQAIRSMRDVRKYNLSNQVLLLCEAGQSRAYRALSTDASYLGEIWEPEVPELPNHKIEVVVRVSHNDAQSVVEVTASLTSIHNEWDRIQQTIQRERIKQIVEPIPPLPMP